MLLDKLLADYLHLVETTILSLEDAYIERYEEEIIASDRLNLRIRIRFNSKALLEINEGIIKTGSQLKHLAYRYHLQDENNKLIFRYDNAPHFPSLETFPDHKHLADKVVESHKPSLTEIIKEAANLIK